MALVARIRNGDSVAECELVRQFGQRVFVMAWARTRDRMLLLMVKVYRMVSFPAEVTLKIVPHPLGCPPQLGVPH